MTIHIPGSSFMRRFTGAEVGYNVEADVLSQTADGRSLNDLWDEFRRVTQLYNSERTTLVDFLTFPVTQVIEDVPQGGTSDFEEASEFGVPKGQRASLDYFSMAYDFKWYDLATRYTWKFLAEASASQVEALHQQALEADNRKIFQKVMHTLFRNTNRSATIKGQNYTVFALYNADGTIPPPYKGNTFDGTETHYLASGAATVDSGDLEALINKLDDKGYSKANGTQQVILVNKQEGDIIRSFRANTENNNGAIAKYDFIPAQGQPTSLLQPGTIVTGPAAPASIGGLEVIGSYGSALIAQDSYIPAGYMVIIGTGGEKSLRNPIGFREHAQPALRGLRQIPGSSRQYPLVDSYYSRGFGTGIRQRGGAAVMQITAGSYTIPSLYATV